jgi:hypothetical protein
MGIFYRDNMTRPMVADDGYESIKHMGSMSVIKEARKMGRSCDAVIAGSLQMETMLEECQHEGKKKVTIFIIDSSIYVSKVTF